jgi:hypothetical protein
LVIFLLDFIIRTIIRVVFPKLRAVQRQILMILWLHIKCPVISPIFFL